MAKKKDVMALELGTAISKPNIQWDAGIYTMRQLLQNFQLPRVIRCDPNHFDLPTDNNTFNMAQAMLLYRQRTVRKLVANNLNYDKTNGKFIEIHRDQLLIPEDYKGWFAYSGDPKTITTDPGIPVYTTVQNTAASGATKFLIGGTEKIVGLQMPSSKSSQKPDSRTVFPGDVFKVAGTYVATTKYTKKRVFKDKLLSREEKFLLCIDEGDREVLLPFGAKGQFHIITSSKNNVQVPMMQLHEINKFPCVLKLVYGRSPSTPCSFTGTLLCSASFMEESIVSSTVFNVNNILLEIPVETVLKYNVAKDDQELVQNKGYKLAMTLCKERAEVYMRQIKVSIKMPDGPDDVSIYSGPEHVAPAPPVPPARNRKSSTPVGSTDYKQTMMPKTNSTSHLEMLLRKVPIQSNSNVTLCFGNSSIRIPVDQYGTIRAYRSRTNHPSAAQMFSPPQYDVPSISPSSSFRGSSSPKSTGGDSTDDRVIYENVSLLREVAKNEISDLPPPIPCRAPMLRISSEEFNTSPFDDLRLGATAFSFDSQSVADSGVGAEDFQNSELTTLTVGDVQVALRQYGIKQDTLSVLKAKNIDGKSLSKMNFESLQESFPTVRQFEIRKIALFIECRGQMF